MITRNVRPRLEVSSLHGPRVEELSPQQGGPEVEVDTEGGHLGVGQGELLPPEVEDLPVVFLNILKTLHWGNVSLYFYLSKD